MSKANDVKIRVSTKRAGGKGSFVEYNLSVQQLELLAVVPPSGMGDCAQLDPNSDPIVRALAAMQLIEKNESGWQRTERGDVIAKQLDLLS